MLLRKNNKLLVKSATRLILAKNGPSLITSKSSAIMAESAVLGSLFSGLGSQLSVLCTLGSLFSGLGSGCKMSLTLHDLCVSSLRRGHDSYLCSTACRLQFRITVAVSRSSVGEN